MSFNGIMVITAKQVDRVCGDLLADAHGRAACPGWSVQLPVVTVPAALPVLVWTHGQLHLTSHTPLSFTPALTFLSQVPNISLF